MNKTAVFIFEGKGFKGIEGQFADRVSRQLLQEGNGRILDVYEIKKNKRLKLKDLYKYKNHDIFVFIYGSLYISREGIKNLSAIVRKQRDFSVIVPVSNESRVSLQRHAPSFIYQTLSVFKWAMSEVYAQFKDKIIQAEETDDFCFAFKNRILDGLPDDCLLIDLPRILKESGLRFGIAKGVYVHRYGDCYESRRDDLLVHVPSSARSVLDIGCANGLFGEMLKKRQTCSVTGVDFDTELLDTAKGRLDKVINGDIEEIVGKGILGKYDCIICGDVLEHLKNPWKLVKGLKTHLKKGGLFIASTPNVANWAVIHEIIKGRWDYVPFSILSGTHIRFFTRQTLIELFEDSGYKVKKTLLQHFEMPDKGKELVTMAKKIFPEVNEEELKASEIIIIAE